MAAILGKKLGMAQIFTEEGDRVPVTVIEAGPCAVTQVKTEETDGYRAIQIGFGEVKERKLTKAEAGHLKKAGVSPRRHLIEVRGDAEAQPGDEITVEAFEAGQKIKVSGVSKGKGFAGVVKRHGFSGGPASHGSHFHRAPGSVGASAWPSRVFKGLKLPGHMGARKSTQLGLTVVGTDPEKNLLFVKGAVPGSKNEIVFIQGQ
ncbi:MAG: 50S ribosomal protein L3 [Gaiellales bacterium]|nr:MAG: 50S ribosomal protein L3 [Gaiellales bacterium]